jgi:DNA modification methylase
LVADPFGGLGTTGVCAIEKGRRAFLTELNSDYSRCSLIYLRIAEQKASTPTLFDFLKDAV